MGHLGGRTQERDQLLGSVESGRVPVQDVTIADAREIQPDRLRAVRLQQLGHEHHVAQRLAHLLAVHPEHASMHPDPGEWPLIAPAFGLGDFGLVVRVDEVAAAAVDIERLAKVAYCHRRTLDVPAWPAGAPRAGPGWLIGPGGLPEQEVDWG